MASDISFEDLKNENVDLVRKNKFIHIVMHWHDHCESVWYIYLFFIPSFCNDKLLHALHVFM